MMLAQDQVHGATVSEAWMNAVQAVDATPKRRLFHLVTRVSDPVTEEPRIRAAADTLLHDLDLAPVDTVANTIFPAELAASSAGPGELAQRYRRLYPTLRRLHKSNRRGTYFGRIVAHPGAGGERDQLTDLIERLNTELRTPGPKSARYEMNISEPGDLARSAESCTPDAELVDCGPVHLYAAGTDTSPMGFPCLSFCSFQLDSGHLHMIAQYRYQYLIERGYGNYLGLGQLLGYVCTIVGLHPGQLTIVAGVAAVDSAARYRIAQLAESARRK
jgi:thymidylate synthase